MGGGPSLKGFDAEILRGKGRVIAINEAGLTMAPWADVHFFPDLRWIGWNIDRLDLFTGRHRITRQSLSTPTSAYDKKMARRVAAAESALNIKYVERDTKKPFSWAPTKVAGSDGGSNALNMAALFGAALVVLLGFDMRPGNWHDKHQKQALVSSYGRFRENMTRMVPFLEKHGVEVINCTLGSALECFPKKSLEAIL